MDDEQTTDDVKESEQDPNVNEGDISQLEAEGGEIDGNGVENNSAKMDDGESAPQANENEEIANPETTVAENVDELGTDDPMPPPEEEQPSTKMQDTLEELDEEAAAAFEGGEEAQQSLIEHAMEQGEQEENHQMDMEYDSEMPRISERLSPEHFESQEYREGDEYGDLDHEHDAAQYASVDRFEATTPTGDREEDGGFGIASNRTPRYSDHYGEEEEDIEEEEEEEELVLNREALIESYREALQEKKQLHDQNMQLQTKLAEYFRKRKADSETNGRPENEKTSADHEQRYVKYVSTLDELRRQFNDMQDEYRTEIESLKMQCSEKQQEVDEERSRFMQYKKGVGLKAVSGRTGRPVAPAELEELLENEYRKETDVVAVRLENIKLQNQLRKEEMILKSKEELAEGLHMIDFEQLKIENQTYNEKIEERNEELMKLKKKITSTVQILTHVKEKLQFVEQENQFQRQRQQEVDVLLKDKRDKLGKIKQKRDALRMENHRLKQNCGLLGNEALLRNFEECVDIVDERKNRLEAMRKEHAQLTLTTKGYTAKISVARSSKT